MAGSEDQAATLCRRDAVGAGTVAGMPAQPDLDEYQRRTVQHDQVDLAEPAAVIARNEFEPRLGEVRECRVLRCAAGDMSRIGGQSGLAPRAGRQAAARHAHQFELAADPPVILQRQ